MAKKRSGKGENLIPEDFTQRACAYSQELQASGVPVTRQAKESGLGRTQVYEVRDGKATVESAEMFARYLADRHGREIWPPAMKVRDMDHYRWIRAGEILKRVNPTLFSQLLDIANSDPRVVSAAAELKWRSFEKARKLRTRGTDN